MNPLSQQLLKKYPWIAQDNAKLIISPDSDGFLSALLYLNYFNARVAGYYDCKVMLCEEGVDPRDCIFVDLDIFCRDIRSVGHHMVCYNKNRLPANWHHYDNAIQLNNLRGFDSMHDFQRKYPFATIHFLLSLLENVPGKNIRIAQDAVIPLLFSDGVCNNLFGYPENCLDWLRWLDAGDPNSLLNGVFYHDAPFAWVMERMDQFFKKRDKYNSVCWYDPASDTLNKKSRTRSGHHMLISDSKGNPINIVQNASETYDILPQERERTIGFITLMAELMGWEPLPQRWRFRDLKLYQFKKDSYSTSSQVKLNGNTYSRMAEDNCFSMAITAGTTIEFTLDTEHYFR